MEYLFDLHVHTATSSSCGETEPEDIVKRYIGLGYDGICITDHMNSGNFGSFKGGQKAKSEQFLEGYRRTKAAAGDRLKVILGMEIRFLDCGNDYLVFGFDEKFIMENKLHKFKNLEEFHPFAKENGLVVYQAHPFRPGLKIINYELLDGMEVYNGHGGHDSANDIAYAWAKKRGLRMSSASDFHYDTGKEPGGVYFKELPNDSFELAKLLLENDYRLKIWEEAEK